MLNIGIVSQSRMENERRAPVHPDHFEQIVQSLRTRMHFERGYGEPFDVPDVALESRFGQLMTREEILADCDIVLLPKPLESDLRDMRAGRILWGWPHCVQQQGITQAAIDKRHTLLAWEAMFMWKGEVRDMHLFARNNEMAGYCGVAHAFALAGVSGCYGPPMRAVVLSFGSVSRGAIAALRGRGVENVTVYTRRPPVGVTNAMHGVRYGRMGLDADGGVYVVEPDGRRRGLIDSLAEADVIVNGILQDTDAPLQFVREGEVDRLRPGAIIVDVSCDEGMGFPFARPTSFESPTFRVGGVTYYAVNHTPTWLWRSASWELSRVVVAYLETVMGGPEAWARNETIRRCIEIRDGEIQNPKILSFQNRDEAYPHAIH